MSDRMLTDGSPVPADGSHKELRADGQQRGYIVLTPEERAKGFIQPVRHQYVHNGCGATTWMSNSLAETYARDPWFYGGTYCSTCCSHFPLHEFRWAGSDESLCPGHWTDEKSNQVAAAKKALKDAAP